MPGVTTTTQNLPPWLDVLLRAAGEQSSGLAKEPYTPYKGQRYAPINPYIIQSENILGGLQNQYTPYANLANQSLQQSLRQFPQNVQQYARPGQQQLNTDIQSALKEFPENVQRYMNPYQQHVVNQISTLGNRNFQENILPALEAHFTNLGQHGSSRHANLSQIAARDLQEAILREQQQALAHGYEAAGNLFNIQQQRELEAARLKEEAAARNYEAAGNLFSADQLRALEAARSAANIGQQHQGATIGSAAAIGHAGEAQRARTQQELDIPYENYLRQQEYPSQRLNEHVARLHGQPHSTQSSSFNVQAPPPGQPRTNTAGRIGELAGSFLGARKAGIFKEGGSVLSSLVSHSRHKKSKPKTGSYFGVVGLKFNTHSPKVGKHPSRHGRL